MKGLLSRGPTPFSLQILILIMLQKGGHLCFGIVISRNARLRVRKKKYMFQNTVILDKLMFHTPPVSLKPIFFIHQGKSRRGTIQESRVGLKAVSIPNDIILRHSIQKASLS